MKLPFQPPGGLFLNILAAQWVVPESWDHSELQAPYWRLYWNAGPGMFLRSHGRRVPLVPEHFVLIPPETSFSAHMDEPAVHFYVHFLTSCAWQSRKVQGLPVSAQQKRFLSGLVAGDPSLGGRWKISALVADCLEALPSAHWSPDLPLGARVQAAVEAIASRFPGGVRVGDLASQAGMNVNAFIRVFRGQTGKTPAAYQMEQRISMACLLLHHSSYSIERVAADCGFCDRYYFSRAFKNARGVSPGTFRRQFGTQAEG